MFTDVMTFNTTETFTLYFTLLSLKGNLVCRQQYTYKYSNTHTYTITNN